MHISTPRHTCTYPGRILLSLRIAKCIGPLSSIVDLCALHKYDHLFIHSPVEGHPSCFQCMATANKDVNIPVFVFFKVCFHVSLINSRTARS